MQQRRYSKLAGRIPAIHRSFPARCTRNSNFRRRSVVSDDASNTVATLHPYSVQKTVIRQELPENRLPIKFPAVLEYDGFAVMAVLLWQQTDNCRCPIRNRIYHCCFVPVHVLDRLALFLGVRPCDIWLNTPILPCWICFYDFI